jgi:hypothetical protein
LKEPGEVVVLEVALAAEAISCRLAAGKVAQEAADELNRRTGQSDCALLRIGRFRGTEW